MVAASALVGLLVIVAVHTLIAAVAIRFFRVHMNTRWGAAVYAVLFVPVALVVSTLVLSGVLKLGGEFGGRETVLVLVVLAPLLLGASIDFFWMPPPEEIELPEVTGEG